MKTNRRNPLLRSAVLSAIVIAATQTLHAASGTWNVNNGGNWSATGNWLNGIVADDDTSTANFVFNITAARTVTLDSSRTINKIVFTDATTASHDWTLARSNNAVLTLAGTDPSISSTNRTATVSAVIDATTEWSKIGNNVLVLTGANTFSGDLKVSNGTLRAGAAAALGAAANIVVENAESPGSMNLNTLELAGGFTYGSGKTLTLRNNSTSNIANARAYLVNQSGNNTWAGAIVLDGGTNQALQSSAGVLTITGDVSVSGSPPTSMFIRGGGSAVMNGNFNLGTTNFVKTDSGAWTINSTGNTHGQTTVANGSVTVNNNEALSPGTNIGFGEGNANTATLNINAGFTQTVGNVSINGASTTAAGHRLNGPGSINLGATPSTFTINNAPALDDLTMTVSAIKGSGGLTKEGDGTLALQNVTSEVPLTINAGTLATSGFSDGAASTLSTPALAFGPNPTALRMKVGTASDLINAGSVTTAGTTTITINQSGGLLAVGTYPLIDYAGTTPGLTGFALNPVGHATATLVDTAGAISLEVTANDSVLWDGTISDNWVGANGDWKRSSNSAATDYIDGDVVIFNDAPVSSNVIVGSDVNPSSVTFNNTSATAYTVSGAGRIIGTTGLTKNGDGDLTLANPNAYSGPTTINAGSVIANFTTGTAIPTASAITMAAGTSLTLGHNGGAFALNNAPVGSGTLIIDPNLSAPGNRDLTTVTWDATGFTGTMRLSSSSGGTMRLQANALTDIGSGPIEITNGGQLYINTGGLTFPHNFTIEGTGWSEAAGTLGAIRTSGTTNLTGTITVSGSGKIGALGGTAIVSNILTGGDLTFGGSANQTGSETLAITGDASGLTSLTVNDGSAASGATSITVNVGNGGTTGTLDTVPVTLKPDGFKNAVLRFDRSDGYTLGSTITSAATTAANEIRSFVDFDCTGTGFDDDGGTITLGVAAPASGGRIRIGATRANALATVTGTITSEVIQLAGGQNNATLNINNGASLTANQLYVGDSNNNSGTVNQATGTTVNVVGQVRVGHFTTNTSTYNLSGGALTLTGDTPNNSPSTAAGGGANLNGDNNLNTLAANQILGGGVYLGNDGTGIFNHTGGTLTTNWIVLDNRGDTPAGANMPDGIDRYNLSGTGLLKLRSTYGLIARNASTDVSFGGGTVQVDNTGTGVGTGANLNIPLDAAISTVASTTTTLDTNGAGNAFTLTKDVNGSGTLALTGGGAINLSPAGAQTISAALAGSNPINKLGTGTTILAGSMAGLTGPVTVTEGRLNVPASLNTTVTVQPNGLLAGEISLPTLNLDGGTVLFDPNTAGTLTVNTLNLNANSLLDVSAAPGVGTFTALTYTSKTGSGTLAVANGSTYRTPPVVNDTGTAVTTTYAAGKALTWTGTVSGVWDINTAINWTDGVNPETFFSGDSVTFPETGANPAITLTGLIAPAGVSVTSDTTNYTFTSSVGNLITGTTGLTKSGTSTLTLIGANAYSGITSISGGTISVAEDSLGSGIPGNSIALSGGGKLSYTGTVAADLGINRSIAVGTGGGILEHNSATAATISIPGALSGSEALTFQSAAAGGGTFSLTGNNAAFTGAINVSAVSTGLATLRVNSTDSLSNASSITVNYPAGATGSGSANSLTLLDGVTVPATTTINLTSGLPTTALSLRSQVATTGNVTINGPIKLAGDTIVQVVPAAGSTATLNGNISEASPGSFAESPLQTFTNVFFLRGSATSTIIVNGQVNLPSAGSTLAVTDGATVVINSTGNDFKSASAAYGTIQLGATNAIPATARLVIGQGGNQNCTLDLNGFDQTVTDLVWSATSASIAKGVSNTHPTNTSTFTINQLAAPAANFSGTFTGAINLVKDGPATTTLSTALSTFTGNVAVKAGQLTIAAGHNDTNANSALGLTNVDTRTVTVEPGATLAFTGNDNLGNAASAPVLPIIVEAGALLTNSGFNTMGPVTLNGGTMTSTGGANATFQSYRLFGTVTAGGTAASLMSASGTNSGYHLHSTTAFNVADAVAGAAADLTVSAPLRNQSGTQGGAAGNLVKDGTGTMVLAGVNTYTGDTVVSDGTLQLADDAQLRFVIGAASGTNNSLSGSGTAVLDGDFAIDTTAAAALTGGTWVLENVASLTGAYGTNFQVVNTDGSPWSNTGDTWTKDGGAGKTWTFDETTGTLTLSQSGYASWASANAGGQDPDLDFDLDGVENGVEFFMGETGSTFTTNPTVVTTGGVRTVTWPKSASFNGTYRVETSDNLVNWTNVTGSVVDNGSSVVYTLPTGSPKVFVRLVVTPN
jgi:autotransporter-associated beta strand protein